MVQKIQEIKEQFQAASEKELPDFINEYGMDERPGIQKMVEKAKKMLEAYEREKIRIDRKSVV